MIDRNSVELYDDYDVSSQASSNTSSQSSAKDMIGDEGDKRLVHDDVRCMGSGKYLNDERDNLMKEMYEHNFGWSTQRDFVKAKKKRQRQIMVTTFYCYTAMTC